MLDYPERCQQSAIVRFRQRRAFPVGSPGWNRAVREARRFVRAYRFARGVEAEERLFTALAVRLIETKRRAERSARDLQQIDASSP
jgi:hypothetical protein